MRGRTVTPAPEKEREQRYEPFLFLEDPGAVTTLRLFPCENLSTYSSSISKRRAGRTAADGVPDMHVEMIVAVSLRLGAASLPEAVHLQI
jgi:hypothetical protein